MKILYDHQIFTDQSFGGISKYFSELVKFFQQSNEVETQISLKYSNNEYIKDIDNTHKNFFINRGFKGKKFLMTLVNERESKKILNKENFDIFHPTYYNNYFINKFFKKPFVITFYDMIHEKLSYKYPSLNDDTFKFKKSLIQKCSKVIAISESTKKDIMDIFHIPDYKIQVTHLASSFPLRGPIKSKENNLKHYFPSEFILFVGMRGLYKNFRFFLNSISGFLKKEGLYLICAGGGEFTNEEKNFIAEKQLHKLVIYQSINESTLPLLYSSAIAFFFPSEYEGFGIPILEAFSSGCPCAISNCSSFPEVAGNAALYFDPNDKESILNATKTLVFDSSLQDNLRDKGYERLKNFSWEKTAAETLNIYKTLI